MNNPLECVCCISASSSSSATKIFCDTENHCSVCICNRWCKSSYFCDRAYFILKRLCHQILKNYNRKQSRESYTIFNGGNSTKFREMTDEQNVKIHACDQGLVSLDEIKYKNGRMQMEHNNKEYGDTFKRQQKGSVPAEKGDSDEFVNAKRNNKGVIYGSGLYDSDNGNEFKKNKGEQRYDKQHYPTDKDKLKKNHNESYKMAQKGESKIGTDTLKSKVIEHNEFDVTKKAMKKKGKHQNRDEQLANNAVNEKKVDISSKKIKTRSGDYDFDVGRQMKNNEQENNFENNNNISKGKKKVSSVVGDFNNKKVESLPLSNIKKKGKTNIDLMAEEKFNLVPTKDVHHNNADTGTKNQRKKSEIVNIANKKKKLDSVVKYHQNYGSDAGKANLKKNAINKNKLVKDEKVKNGNKNCQQHGSKFLGQYTKKRGDFPLGRHVCPSDILRVKLEERDLSRCTPCCPYAHKPNLCKGLIPCTFYQFC